MTNAAPEKPKKEKKNDEPRVEKGTLHLECLLTKEEVSTAAKALAEAIQRKGGIEQRLDSFRTQNKAEVAEVDAVITKQTQLVSAEKEYRFVPVEITFDWKSGKKTAVRLDTKEQVWCHEISNEERQLKLA